MRTPALINNQFLDSLSVLVRQMKVSNFFIDLVSLADIKKGGKIDQMIQGLIIFHLDY